MAVCPFAEFRDVMTPAWKAAHRRSVPPRLIVWHTQGFDSHGQPPVPPSSDGSSWHFWIAFDGRIIQFVDTAYVCGHAWAANPFSIGVESEDAGDPIGPWTDAQEASRTRLAEWAHDALHIPLDVCQTWDGSGQGYHRQFSQWNQSHHSCPGNARVAQFPAWAKSLTAPAPVVQTTTATQGGEVSIDSAISPDGRWIFEVGRGDDDNIWWQRIATSNGNVQTVWTAIPRSAGGQGGAGAFSGSPSVCFKGDGTAIVTAPGNDRACWRNSLPPDGANTQWAGWWSDGGLFH